MHIYILLYYIIINIFRQVEAFILIFHVVISPWTNLQFLWGRWADVLGMMPSICQKVDGLVDLAVGTTEFKTRSKTSRISRVCCFSNPAALRLYKILQHHRTIWDSASWWNQTVWDPHHASSLIGDKPSQEHHGWTQSLWMKDVATVKILNARQLLNHGLRPEYPVSVKPAICIYLFYLCLHPGKHHILSTSWNCRLIHGQFQPISDEKDLQLLGWLHGVFARKEILSVNFPHVYWPLTLALSKLQTQPLFATMRGKLKTLAPTMQVLSSRKSIREKCRLC